MGGCRLPVQASAYNPALHTWLCRLCTPRLCGSVLYSVCSVSWECLGMIREYGGVPGMPTVGLAQYLCSCA